MSKIWLCIYQGGRILLLCCELSGNGLHNGIPFLSRQRNTFLISKSPMAFSGLFSSHDSKGTFSSCGCLSLSCRVISWKESSLENYRMILLFKHVKRHKIPNLNCWFAYNLCSHLYFTNEQFGFVLVPRFFFCKCPWRWRLETHSMRLRLILFAFLFLF